MSYLVVSVRVVVLCRREWLARRGTRVGEMEYSGAPLMGDGGYSGGGEGCMVRGIVVRGILNGDISNGGILIGE